MMGDEFLFNNALIAVAVSPMRNLDSNTSTTPFNHQEPNLQTEGVDEYVSFDCVKKLLDEQDMDYMDSTMHNHIELEYFNEIL